MPCLQENQAVLNHECAKLAQLMPGKPSGPDQLDRFKLELRQLATVRHVHVGWFQPFVAEEEEPEAPHPEDGRRHALRIPASLDLPLATPDPSALRASGCVALIDTLVDRCPY
jgi:hypothetical protein